MVFVIKLHVPLVKYGASKEHYQDVALCEVSCVLLMVCSKRYGGIERGERREGWEGNSRWLSEARGTGEMRERERG